MKDLNVDHWPLGRVAKTFPDGQGRVRRVEIMTSKGTFQRTVQYLVRLPVADEIKNGLPILGAVCSTSATWSPTR